MDNQLVPPTVEISGDSIDFKMLLEKAPVMLWLTNSTGEVIFLSGIYKTFIGGENVGGMGEEAWFKTIHPDDQQGCLSIFEKAFQTHQSFIMEYRLKRYDGEYRHIVDLSKPYVNHEGKFSGFIGSSTDITESKLSEDKFKTSNLQLIQHNQEMSLINELNAELQVCRELAEIYPVVSHHIEKIFPDWIGELYLFNENKSLVESVSTWGSNKNQSNAVMEPNDCWALHQGKTHNALDMSHRLLCNHSHEQMNSYTCIPIIAQGEMAGVLHMEYTGDIEFESQTAKKRYLDSRLGLMKTAADNLALSIVSLELREALKRQSIRDPLTSLFNRGYMEESLDREIARCERAEEGIGVILVDIDHFKSINDNFGHDAGNFVLVEFANFMAKYFRQSDIVCRFGGDEFIIVVPSAPQNLVVERATQLCYKLHDLNMHYEGKKLPSMTASFGVAYLLGDDYSQSLNMIKLADEAVQKAKRAGRDQVIVYESTNLIA